MGLASVDHIVVLMLENRSFDHMLGYLYPGNLTPSGQPFEWLTGTESDPDASGNPVTAAACRRFVTNYAYTLGRAVYGYDEQPLTKSTFTQITNEAASRFGLFTDFQAAAAAGTLPPWGAVPPDNSSGEYGFGFDRFGPRVPTVLVSPLIEAGTVFRVPAGGPPLDHASILKTVEQRWNLPSLTARVAAAPGFGDVLTLTTPRTDDVLAGVTVPVSPVASPSAGTISHLEHVRAELLSRQVPAGSQA